MASITAIELGPDTCAFARTSGRSGQIRLLASEILDPAAFPGTEAFTVAVRRTRRAFHLPRRSRVVVWGLPDGANLKDAAVKPLLKPLTDAGFRVERVVTPCNALAALARLKTSRGDGSACWVAINRGGVAIVAVRPGKLLHAHSFAWDSTVGATGSQARLLQRYLLVSHLSPFVKRAMAEARKSGSAVGVVVTCGNLPDLRSLTMPLIEELDIEVETLDSLEGLVVKPEAAEKLAETASAIRLACAAVIARGSRPWDPTKKKSSRAIYIAAAVLAALLAGLAYLWYAPRRSAATVAPASQSQPARAAASPPTPPVPLATTGATPPTSSPPVVSAPPVRPSIEGGGSRVGGSGTVPRALVPPPRAQSPHSIPPAVSAPAKPAVPAAAVPVAARRPQPAPLGDAVPRVTGILVSNNRRYATLEGGRIVGIGDLVGRRTVVGIDQGSVLFREPSGVRLRMGLGGRRLTVEREAR